MRGAGGASREKHGHAETQRMGRPQYLTHSFEISFYFAIFVFILLLPQCLTNQGNGKA